MAGQTAPSLWVPFKCPTSLCPLQIASPVAGLAKPAGTDAISIKPVTAGFTDYEIFLSNIRLHIAINDTGTFVDAGQVGGVVVVVEEMTE